MSVTNISSHPFTIEQILPLGKVAIRGSEHFDRILFNGKATCDYSALCEFDDGFYNSNAVAGFTNAEGTEAMVIGFMNPSDAFYEFDISREKDQLKVTPVCKRESVLLAAKDKLIISELSINLSSSLSCLMEQYAEKVAKNMGVESSDSLTGWCSWYYYYDRATEQDIWNNIDAIKKSPLRDELKVIQIDDGWNLPNSDHTRVWGDWTAGSMFPEGMKELAGKIKLDGFVPGLWLAPFSVDKQSNLYKNHSDWVIKNDDNPPYGLDLSNPSVLNFIEDTFERVFNEWGFDYVKIDFIHHADYSGLRYDNTKTSAELLRNALKIIRDIAGNRFVLCCGCPMTAAIGLCDAMRIGYDVSSRWGSMVELQGEDWPVGNLSIHSAAIHTIWRHWMHTKWWQNDPDCLIVRDYGSIAEKSFMQRFLSDHSKELPYGLSEEDALFWLRFVWITGGMSMISENIKELTKHQLNNLKSFYPLNKLPTILVDWYKDPEVVVMKICDKEKIIGIFNLKDEEVSITVPVDKFSLGSAWKFREKLTGEMFSDTGSNINFPRLPAHGARLWKLL